MHCNVAVRADLFVCRRKDRQFGGEERWPECAEQDVLYAGQEAELVLSGYVIRASEVREVQIAFALVGSWELVLSQGN